MIYVKKDLERELENIGDIMVENYGDCLIVRTRSRRVALSLVNRFKNYLCLE